MKIAKPTKVPVLSRVLEHDRSCHFHVAAMLGFPLSAPRAVVDEISFWKTTLAALGDGILDEGFARAHGELLVGGSFFAPGGKPVPASYVRAKLGSIDKRLAILGDRVWEDGVPSEPVPISEMPVDWAHAFGGPTYGKNPYGKGAAPIESDGGRIHSLPNVELYDGLMRNVGEHPEPAGFLPMDIGFAQRRKRAGTYDGDYLNEAFPGMPADMAPSFFNVAPEDQWIDSAFHGDEEFLLENMHPDEPKISGRLPGLVMRCFATHRTASGDRFVEIPMRWDTVWLFPAVRFGVVISHGVLPIASDDAADIVNLVYACEEPSSPRTSEHYQQALLRRLDKDKGALAGISDSDLMPSRESGVLPNIDGLDVGAWIRSENLLSANARRGAERQFAVARQQLEAGGMDGSSLELPPSTEAPDVDDLDALVAFAEAAEREAETAMVNAELTAKKNQEETRRQFAEANLDYDAEMARAEREGAGPPKFSAERLLQEIAGRIAEARNAGSPIEELERLVEDPVYRAELLEQERGLRESYRRSGHLQPKASPMSADDSERVRTLVGIVLESNEALAGRDFTGANLAGLRLQHIDLSDAFLEATDLSGCDLSGANLEGAVLAKANLRGANLSNARLAGANLGGASLCDAVFDGADLTNAVLDQAELSGARFADATMTDAQWFETKLGGADCTGANIGACTFLKTDVRGASFKNADLSQATFIECDIREVDFSGATLFKTSFLMCKGEGALFRDAKFRQGSAVHGTSFANADFRDADMEKTNLRGTVLTGARFDRTSLKGADLSECDASGGTFERAVIQGALLIRTNLVNASLRGASLVDAIASKARIGGADFTGANLYRADVSRTIGDEKTTFAEAELGHVRHLPKAVVPPRSDT